MKKEKVKSSFYYEVLCFLIIFIVAFLFTLNDWSFKYILNSLVYNSLYIQLILIFLGAIPSLLLLFNIKKDIYILEKLDEEESLSFEEKLDDKIDFVSSINSVLFIIHFILFAISLNNKNPNLIQSVMVFILLLLIKFYIDSKLFKLINQKNPNMNISIWSNELEENFLKSCDEAEKQLVYRTTYATFSSMKTFLLTIFILALSLKIYTDVSDELILSIGFIWLSHTVIYIYHSFKSKNKV